ncbi:hypothetical protein J437_LFUL008103 [Ladona fulva]|uniref:Uncharacterized protein n=1 Tax=Ladona fulva TaxID=123851 RepID=A0A8K0K487_LADFU|nr:hypothetical protein J437_LFUL008103 [Ladona fulva]
MSIFISTDALNIVQGPPCSSLRTPSISCDTCLRDFHGEGCFEKHRLKRGKGESTCKTVRACPRCRSR